MLLQFTDDTKTKQILVFNDEKLIWAYHYGNTPKPYIHPFATPQGEVVTLASPHDHLHHRGIMLAWRVNGVNFWEEFPTEEGEKNGQIKHLSWEKQEAADNQLQLVESLKWVGNDGQEYLVERRTLTVWLDEHSEAVVCRWQSDFSTVGGEVEISGYTPYSPISYYGLGFRFARALDIGGKHLGPEGEINAESPNGHRASWHYYHGKLDETSTEVGVLIADDPGNARHPTPWFHISHPPAPFAYVSASFIAHKPYLLKESDVLTLRYQLSVHEGTWTKEQCNAHYRKAFRIQ